MSMIKSRGTIQYEIGQFLPDNVSGDISAADVRQRLIDITDSFVLKSGDSGIASFLRYGSALTFANDNDLVSKKYVDDSVSNSGGLRRWSNTKPYAVGDYVMTIGGQLWYANTANIGEQPGSGSSWTIQIQNNSSYGPGWAASILVPTQASIYTIIEFIKKQILSNSEFKKKFTIPEGSVLFSVGDSITEYDGYIDIVSATVGATLDNRAVSGHGAFRAISNAHQYNAANTQNASCTWMAGFNDYRRNSSNPTKEKCRGALRSYITNAFLKTKSPASAESTTGSWTVLGTGIGDLAHYIGGTPMYTTGVGNTIQYSFVGTSLVIGTWGVDGVVEKGGVIEIKIDGNVVDTYNSDFMTDGISDSTNANTRTPRALVYQNLSPGPHTVVVTVLSVTGIVYIDYFGTLKPPQACQTVLVYDIPKMDSTGYAISPANASDSVFNEGDDVQVSVINEFKSFPVVRVMTNEYYDISTGLSGDHIHPNMLGFAQIASASLVNISQTPTIPEIPDSILNQYSSPQDAKFWIKRNMRVGDLFINYDPGYSTTSISVNRDPEDGTIIDDTKAVAVIHLFTETNGSEIRLFTGNAAGMQAERVKIDKDGDVIIRGGKLYFGDKNVPGSGRIIFQAGGGPGGTGAMFHFEYYNSVLGSYQVIGDIS